MHKASYLILSVFLGLFCISQVNADQVYIENPSFELPQIDPDAFPVSTYADGWTEIDNDNEYSTNTGAFRNTEPNSFDHIVNVDGEQCAFLGSEAGNGFVQDLNSVYKAGYDYRFTVSIGISSQFPPSQLGLIDTLELALFYRDSNDPNIIIDIAAKTVEATGQLMTMLQDFSLHLPTVAANAVYSDKNIGIAIRSTGNAGGFWNLDNVRLTELLPESISIKNPSFEFPVIDPENAYGAGPIVDDWREVDVAPLGDSVNTGVFVNTEPNSFDHIINADANQLAFLFTEQGNALEQDLEAKYNLGCSYLFTVAVGVSSRIPPTDLDPPGKLELALYYYDVNEPNETFDIVSRTIEATGLVPTILQDFSIYLDPVTYDTNWIDNNIGIAIRAKGPAGAVWVMDDVRLVELLPGIIPIENPSFELPEVDPNGYPAFPLIYDWTEIDNDFENSTNTGVFLNSDSSSSDHIINADGKQLAFLGSEQGNAIEQDLDTVYKTGCNYRLTVGVAISNMVPPSQEEPVDTIELALYYRDANDPNIIIDLATKTIEATGLLSTQLQSFSLYLGTVSSDAEYVGKNIGIAIRATGVAGGFWDLDNVRLGESLPVQLSALEGKE